MPDSAHSVVLSFREWKRREAAHRERAERRTVPARSRRTRRLPHPVEDFLFQYYPFPFSLLEHWHPGLLVGLEWPEAAGRLAPEGGVSERHYRLVDGVVAADPGKIREPERVRLRWMRALLAATASRAGNFACYGLHEWAMVYGGRDVRHHSVVPLRLPQAEIDALVRSRPLCCTHFDAFRFFAAETQPLNRLQPTLEAREALEQPGCVHANMDLYKWAAKAMPWSGSELLLDCFELALELRELDMRASPYDLATWGYRAIRIETAEGRREYEVEQRRLAAAAAPLRQRLIGVLGGLERAWAATNQSEG
jgi:hypothetical protein